MVAEFRYAIDAEHLTVWLEPFATGGTERAGVLCRRHADAMVVPLGWMLDDRRTQVPQLFRTNAAVTAAAADRPRRSRPPTAVPGEVHQLSLDAVADDPVAVHAPPAEPVAPMAPMEPMEPMEPEHIVEAPSGDVVTAPESQSDPDLTPVLPWRPVFDHSDDLDGLLTAQSPLLRRAFGRDRPADS